MQGRHLALGKQEALLFALRLTKCIDLLAELIYLRLQPCTFLALGLPCSIFSIPSLTRAQPPAGMNLERMRYRDRQAPSK